MLTFKIKMYFLLVLMVYSFRVLAAEEKQETIYVSVEPVIVTNYQSKSKKKLGFVQLLAELSVSSKEDEVKIIHHMPIVRDFIVEFLNFSEADLIKDVKKRKTFRKKLASGIQKKLTDEIGEPIIDDLVITRFMWN